MRRRLVVACFAVALWAAPGALASGWCGSGENTADLPDMNTGQQFHAVYMIPADGTDRFATIANLMADDITSIDGWWTTQDPTRTLRFDTAQFPSCVGVDISFVRLADTAAQVGTEESSPTAFSVVGAGLDAAGLSTAPTDAYKNYLVYYDGPPPDPGICGTGDGIFDQGEGLAVVWLNGCPSVPTDSIAAHEALHALGALPAGAPHACPPDQGGPAHPCDSPLDVLSPMASGLPLAQLYLDYGHDDYYDHTGTWDDIRNSPFLYRYDVTQSPLALTVVGAGEVSSDLPGLDCTVSCTTQWDPAATPTLAATPAAGMRFVGWAGACAGASPTCQPALASAADVTATFGPATIAVRTSVAGRGRVACTPTCSLHFAAGTTLQLRAVPVKGWRFVRWSGACTSTALTCVARTDADVTARATFVKIPVRAKKPKRR